MACSNRLLITLVLMSINSLVCTIFAQGVCQTSTGFKILEGNAGCEPFRVTLQNQMNGATDVKYIYYYQGEGINALNGLNPTAENTNAYFTLRNQSSSEFTILQYGKDASGQPFYSCQKVTVKKGIKPQYTFTLCTSGIEVVIPKTTENDNFDRFTISVGNQNKIVTQSELPKSLVFTTTYPAQLQILGESDNQPVLDCNKVTETLIQRDPSLYPDGYEVPFDLNIDTLELVEIDRVRLVINGSLDESGFTLQMREADGNYPSQALKENVKAGPIEISVPNPDLSYCFKLSRRAACLSYEFSAELCTLPITEAQIDEFGEVDLKWINHAIPSTGQTFNQSKGIRISRVNKQIQTRSLPLSASTFNDFMECGVQKICYVLSNTVSGKYLDYKYKGQVISNEVCVESSQLKLPPLDDFYVTINEEQQIETFLQPPVKPVNPVAEYKLFTYMDTLTSLLDSSLTANFNSFPMKTDERSYCFFSTYEDTCARVSIPSDTICTVYLNEKEGSSLSWTPQSPFSRDGAFVYDIESRNEQTGGFELFASSTNDNSLIPNLEKFEEEAVFRVKTTNHLGWVSYSNLLDMPVRFFVYVPDAFSPNADGINDEFRIFARHKQITDFFIQVYDRNGYIVFESRDSQFSWSGKLGSSLLFPGTYNYHLRCENTRREVLKKQGFLLLLN